MSDLTPSPLNLASTIELIDELKSRFDSISITGMMVDAKTGRRAYLTDNHGDTFAIIGMLHMNMHEQEHGMDYTNRGSDGTFNGADDFLHGRT